MNAKAANSAHAWALGYARLVSGEAAVCPACGHTEIQARFVGDLETRLGYGLLWCPSCSRGGRLSRVNVPEDFEMRAWDDDAALDGVPEIRFPAD